MLQMPFSPCPGGLCTDESVLLLKRIFGPVIDAIVGGADPNTISAAQSLLGTVFSIFNSGLLAVGSLIVSYVAAMGTINTANDGEAMGKAWSSVWTPVRIVAGGAVLLPSASGYSFIQLLVLLMSLWSVGFASAAYRAGVSFGILKTDSIVSSATVVAGESLGLREFAKQYLPVSYCARAVNAAYTDAGGTPDVRANQQADRVVSTGGRTEHTFFIKDRNSITSLAGGEPVCGTVKLASHSAAASAEAFGLSPAIAALHSGLSAAKIDAAMGLMRDIDAWTSTMPVSVTQSGWNNVESRRFNEIVKRHEDALISNITTTVSAGTGRIDAGVASFINTLTQGGWATAGGWYQRVGAIRKELAAVMKEPAGSATPPALAGLPADPRAQSVRSSVFITAETILKKSEEPGKGYDASATPATDFASSVPKSASDIDIGSVQQDISSKFGSLVNNTMKGTVNIAIGSSADVDAVSRMKMMGDYLVVAMASTELAKITLQTTVAAVRATVGAAGGVQVLGTKIDGSNAMTAIWDWVMSVPVEQLNQLLSYLRPLAFYFSVFLPSLPYAIFMIAVVGWILGVLQTVIAAPLWAIMHMRPSQTFVGSDAQGYLLLLALFVRPVLVVIGLFASALVADPVIDYVAKAFFEMRGAVVTSTGFFPGALVEFFTFAWWLLAFGLVLLPTLYMIFGLPHVLPDQVLNWINAGVHDLGSTHAMSNVRGGAVITSLAGGPTGPSLGRNGPAGNPLDAPGRRPRDGGNQPGGEQLLSAGPQGVVPDPFDPKGPTDAARSFDADSLSRTHQGHKGSASTMPSAGFQPSEAHEPQLEPVIGTPSISAMDANVQPQAYADSEKTMPEGAPMAAPENTRIGTAKTEQNGQLVSGQVSPPAPSAEEKKAFLAAGSLPPGLVSEE